jgi:hypothetical protein
LEDPNLPTSNTDRVAPSTNTTEALLHDIDACLLRVHQDSLLIDARAQAVSQQHAAARAEVDARVRTLEAATAGMMDGDGANRAVGDGAPNVGIINHQRGSEAAAELLTARAEAARLRDAVRDFETAVNARRETLRQQSQSLMAQRAQLMLAA